MTTQIHVFDILQELNETNSSNKKIVILKKYQDHELLKLVLKMAMDTVKYTYGVSLSTVLSFDGSDFTSRQPQPLVSTLREALVELDACLNKRIFTGHEALNLCNEMMRRLSDNDLYVFERVLDRNIRCNLGRTQVNKVFPELVTKMVYMRCGVYSEKTAKKIKFPAIVQLKADGTYREFTVNSGTVHAKSRSGHSYKYPGIFSSLRQLPDGVYVGELTVKGVKDRALGNGMLNSNEVEDGLIKLDLWDYVTLEEYSNAALKVKNKTEYLDRFDELSKLLNQNKGSSIKCIESYEVFTVQEALSYVSKWMSEGLEGGVLKNTSAKFKNGTSTEQLKMKLCIDTEMRIVGFTEGKSGSKREGKVGAVKFANDEGTVKGQCSGFTDAELNKMTKHPDDYIDSVMTVQFNDLSKAQSHDYFALSHPRFVEIRKDKDETDTLETVQNLKQMAMELK